MYFNYEHCSPFRMCNVIKARLNVIEQFEPLWRNETTMRFKHNQRFPLHFRPSRNNQRKHFPNSRCNSARLNMALNFFFARVPRPHGRQMYANAPPRWAPYGHKRHQVFFFMSEHVQTGVVRWVTYAYLYTCIFICVC